jgi:phage terminase large subunit-like protein
VAATQVGVSGWATTRREGTTSFGPEARDRLGTFGLELFGWQADLLDEWLEVDDAGRLTRRTCGLIVPRRNGKTALILARCLVGMLYLGERRVTYTAHEMSTAADAFTTMRELVEGSKVRELLAKVMTANGKEGIWFRDGQEFRVRTRTAHGGRGLETDLLVVDEAMKADEEHLAALTPLVAKAAVGGRGQQIYSSSAGTIESTVLARIRDAGRAADGTDGAGISYREFSAAEGDDPTDPATWAKANPSMGTPVLDAAFLAGQSKLMRVDEFAREHLGLWGDTADLPAIDPAAWAARAVAAAPAPLDTAVWMAFEVNQSRTAGRVIAMYRAGDGRLVASCVDSVTDTSGIDGDSYAQRVLAVADQFQPEVVGYDPFTGEHVAQLLANNGYEKRMRKVTGGKFANGCQSLLTAVNLGGLVHDGHPDIAADLSRAVGKPFGDGGWLFARRASTSGPIAGAVALGIAVYLAGDELVA